MWRRKLKCKLLRMAAAAFAVAVNFMAEKAAKTACKSRKLC
jgi:hypothetical protein